MENKYKSTLFDLSNEIAIVTGGLGYLGSQFSLTLLESGAKVVILDISGSTYNNKLKDLISLGDNIAVMKIDITNKNDLISTSKKICNDIGTPTVLINNAAIDSPPNASIEENGPFETYPEKILG
ncbi:Short-chain dehydrogenase/reductase SDR (fragment) [groundwater metagenome]|uniref:Short-chain dehydrogenase/reductase SDR n=1 Tax=groundwater metagenome TaxID=717931 RepID=A0A098ED05_9ZZZZ